MRNKRAGALVINANKLLLVTNDSLDFYWSPGGRLEKGEGYVDALHRELREELGLDIKDAQLYRTITQDKDISAHYFLVDIVGEPNPASDEVTGFHWFSREDFAGQKYKVSQYVTDYILPELIKDALL